MKIAHTYLQKTLLFFLFLFNIAAFAADPPPLVMLKNTSNQMIAELDKNSGRLRGNELLIRNIVRRILIPHIDTTLMAQTVVGRLYWQSSTTALQRQFIDQFSIYVIRTYSAALASYQGETVTFYPIRGYSPNQPRLQINSAINRNEGSAIQMQYRVLNKSGNWLVYDFSVDGVSITENYRAQFAATLQQGGLTLLVKKLTEKNAKFQV